MQTPSSAEVSEIIGPAGSDMQMIAADGRGLPDLERGEERAAALVDQRRGDPVRRTGQRIELRDRAGGRDGQIDLADRQRRPFEVGEVDQPRQMRLRLREQPCAARQPRIACRPNRQLRPGFAGGATSVMASSGPSD